MNILWMIYWFLLLLNVIIGVVYFFKKPPMRWLGLIQAFLTIYVVIKAFTFALARDFDKQSELQHLITEIFNGSIVATLLALGFVCIIILGIRNTVVLFKTK